MAGLELREVPEPEALNFARVAELAFGNVATDEEAEATAAEILRPRMGLWCLRCRPTGGHVRRHSPGAHVAGGRRATLASDCGPGRHGGDGATDSPPRGLLNQMMAHQLSQFRHARSRRPS